MLHFIISYCFFHITFSLMEITYKNGITCILCKKCYSPIHLWLVLYWLLKSLRTESATFTKSLVVAKNHFIRYLLNVLYHHQWFSESVANFPRPNHLFPLSGNLYLSLAFSYGLFLYHCFGALLCNNIFAQYGR